MPNSRPSNQALRRVACPAHSYLGNRAALSTFVPAPPDGERKCVVSTVAADSEGQEDLRIRQAALGSGCDL